jgi:hypothetical protein
MLFGACAGGDESLNELDELGEAAAALVTNVIATSRLCSPFVTPEGCVSVPASEPGPRRRGSLPEIDGVRTKNEYARATELSYADTLHKATGTIYVRADQEQVESPLPLTTVGLSVFLENIPFRAPSTAGGREGKFLVIVDEDRFTGSTAAYEAGDHYVELDFLLGTATEGRITKSGVVTRPYPNFQMGACSSDPSMSQIARCNAELRLTLRPSAVRPFPAPNSDLIPGVGFGVFPKRLYSIGGGIPELSEGIQSELETNRRLLLTLLLGRPRGFPLQYMTWNVRRSATSALAGDYEKVSDVAIGKYLASLGADVIGLQEAWNPFKLKLLLAAANDARAAASPPLPPLEAYGPVNQKNTAVREIFRMIGGAVIGDDGGGSGGLYTLTSLPIAKFDFRPFSVDSCKGEDCLKAKGVQWTRILLNPPTPANSTCYNINDHRYCPPPPSGGEYVDVFNLHLQAPNPVLCSDETRRDVLLANLGALFFDPITAPQLASALASVSVFLDTQFNCGESDTAIRTAQLAEASAFIDEVTADRKDRPVVILGDFNIDGRMLGAEYRSMLKALRIGSGAPLNGDLMNPWPSEFTWDIDHGDLAREFVDEWPDGGTCMGTFLGDQTAPTAKCPLGGNMDGDPNNSDEEKRTGQRFDYILLRPPYPIGDPTFTSAKWVAARIDDKPWTSPYPGLGLIYEPGKSDKGPPARLSDHKPVLVGIEHAKLQQPPKFHRFWKHDVTFRVTSADASNESDCMGCGGAVDPYTLNEGYAIDVPQNYIPMFGGQGSECTNQAIVSWPANGCMSNWSFSAKHDPTEVDEQGYLPMLFDEDDTSGDEAMPVTEYQTWPLIAMQWTVPQVLRSSRSGAGKAPPWPVFDTEPIPWCLGHKPTKMCLEVKTIELPPGEQ